MSDSVRNFNDEVLVRITPTGEELWRRHYERLAHYAAEIGLAAQFATPDIERDEEGYTRMQLNQVANIFGEAMFTGSPPPVETTFKFVQAS